MYKFPRSYPSQPWATFPKLPLPRIWGAELERVCFSYSWQDRSLTSRKAVLLLRDMRMGNWEQEWIFLRLRRVFHLHTCPNRVNDQGA